jgi:hypothetical protein
MWLRQARGGPCLPLRREVEAGRNDAERLDVILAAGDGRAEDGGERQVGDPQPAGLLGPRPRLVEQRLAAVEHDRLHPPGTAPAATPSSPPRAPAG